MRVEGMKKRHALQSKRQERVYARNVRVQVVLRQSKLISSLATMVMRDEMANCT